MQDPFFADGIHYRYGDDPVTFQIALVGCDGIVIGSDRLGTHVGFTGEGMAVFPQMTEQKKYVISDSGSVVCFAAGGYQSAQLAQQIARKCDLVNKPTELQWTGAIEQTASDLPIVYEGRDEILIARRDVADKFWIVRRKIIRPSTAGDGHGTPAVSVTSVETCLCTGEAVAAIFLRHFWNKQSHISELKKLAALALSYAAQESPSSIGPPFDIMCLRGGVLEWTVVENVVNPDFHRAALKLIGKSVHLPNASLP